VNYYNIRVYPIPRRISSTEWQSSIPVLIRFDWTAFEDWWNWYDTYSCVRLTRQGE
jgi:hypothetical protein